MRQLGRTACWKGTARRLAAVGLLVALCAPAPAASQDAQGWRVGGETGTAVLGDGALAHLTLWLSAAHQLGSVQHSLAVSAPLRLMVRDPDPPPRERCQAPALRCEDWDDRGEWTRVLRHWRLADSEGEWSVQAGELSGVSLGHGSLVQRYVNGLRMDRYRTGASGHWRGERVAAEALWGDVVSPHTGAARLAVQPGRLTGLGALTLAAQGAWDVGMERATRSGKADRSRMRLGLDAEVGLWQQGSQKLAWYADWAVAFAGGGGLHTGLLWHSAAKRATHVQLQAEARLLRGAYRPALLDATWEIDRLDGGGRPLGVSGFWSGAMASADVAVPGVVRVVGQVDWGQHNGVGVLAWLTTEAWRGLALRLHAGQRWVQRGAQVGDLDRLYLATQARFAVSGPWFASATVARRWLDLVGGTAPVWEARLSAGAEWRW